VEHLIEDLTRGNVTEVKVVLATVILVLAVYQLFLASVAYSRLRCRFLAAASASWAHRASGDAVLALTVIVATMCVAFYGFDEGGAHAVVACVLLGLLAAKVVAVRLGGRLGRLLPVLGISVLLAFVLTWLTSAGSFLGVT
jgi:Family of unknown function (DUF6529)